jgi:nitroreductase
VTSTTNAADAAATSVPEAERYGDADFVLDGDGHSDTIRLQLRHRSVRKFQPGPVSDGQLAAIIAAAQSAPTSSNLQAWSVVAVRDPERKARLTVLAANQRFIDDAPLFLVWLADLGRTRRLAGRRAVPLEAADYLETTLVAFLDTTLAAQNAIVAAESLGLGTVCVGGIRNHPIDVARELQLPPHTFAVFGLAVGIPDPNEQAGVKPRLPQSSVLHHETYATAAADDALETYDQRLAAYNARFGLSGNWTERVLARLAGPQSMAGRHTIRRSLERLGLPSR